MSIIKKLDQSVINKISAGEYIERPLNAVKELIENSIDAGATVISIHIKGGGQQILKIQDNGSGIYKNDFKILCHRHTTSKITKFSDLQIVETNGFRGEALSALSYVSTVQVISKTPENHVGYSATYKNSEMIKGPTPCAATTGTTITAKNMFLNSPLRQSLVKPDTEKKSIIKLVQQFSLAHPKISFSVVQMEKNKIVFHIQPHDTLVQRMSNLYLKIGHSLMNIEWSKDIDLPTKKHLTEFTDKENLSTTTTTTSLVSQPNHKNHPSPPNNLIHVSWFWIPPNLAHLVKYPVINIFCNNRLIQNNVIKESLVELYKSYHQGTVKPNPWICLFLQVDPHTLDVNVHPSKDIVYILDQSKILSFIHSLVQKKMDITQKSFTPTMNSVSNIASNASSNEKKTRATAHHSLLGNKLSNSLTLSSIVQNSSNPVKLVSHRVANGPSSNKVRESGQYGKSGQFAVNKPANSGSRSSSGSLHASQKVRVMHSQPRLDSFIPRKSRSSSNQPSFPNSPIFHSLDDGRKSPLILLTQIGSSTNNGSKSPHPSPKLPANHASSHALSPLSTAINPTVNFNESFASNSTVASINTETTVNTVHTSTISPQLRSSGNDTSHLHHQSNTHPPSTTTPSTQSTDSTISTSETQSPQLNTSAVTQTTVISSHEIIPQNNPVWNRFATSHRKKLESHHVKTNPPTPHKTISLLSVVSKQKEIVESSDSKLIKILKSATWVGYYKKKAFLQSETGLYMCCIDSLVRLSLYQTAFEQFGNFGTYLLQAPLNLFQCIFSIPVAPNLLPSTITKKQFAARITWILCSKSDMLAEYFGFRIENGVLYRIPILIPQLVPQLHLIGNFLVQLADAVCIKNEMHCFEAIVNLLTEFYACTIDTWSLHKNQYGEFTKEEVDLWQKSLFSEYLWVLEHIILPHLRNHCWPRANHGIDGTIVLVTTTKDLYKAFERM